VVALLAVAGRHGRPARLAATSAFRSKKRCVVFCVLLLALQQGHPHAQHIAAACAALPSSGLVVSSHLAQYMRLVLPLVDCFLGVHDDLPIVVVKLKVGERAEVMLKLVARDEEDVERAGRHDARAARLVADERELAEAIRLAQMRDALLFLLLVVGVDVEDVGVAAGDKIKGAKNKSQNIVTSRQNSSGDAVASLRSGQTSVSTAGISDCGP